MLSGKFHTITKFGVPKPQLAYAAHPVQSLGVMNGAPPPLLGIYFAEFDNTVGPAIIYQVRNTPLTDSCAHRFRFLISLTTSPIPSDPTLFCPPR